jgi:serine/threonine protein kinase
MLRRGDSASESVVPGNSAKMSETSPSDLRIRPDATTGGDPFRLVGERLDGKYEIRAVVAEGGFGVVYQADHRTLRQPVAVKVLKVPADLAGPTRKQFLQKFELEAQTIARLDHPAIVRVLDFGASPMPEGEAAPWMVLEWIEGITLEADLDARRGAAGRTPVECLELMRPVMEALAYAHGEGIAHRDLKPGNLMLTTVRRTEKLLRVLDFGIAKVMTPEESGGSGATATQTKLQAFSPQYAAPEQISATRTGPWTDVHALGLIVTELLTGVAPYGAADTAELYAAVLSPQRPTPARVGIDVGCWEAVLARAVAFRPADRFPDAGALFDALRAEVPVRTKGSLTREVPPREGDFAVTIPRTTVRRTAPRPASVTTWRVAAGALLGLSIVALGLWRLGHGTRSNPEMAGVAPSMSASVRPTVSPFAQAGAGQGSALVVTPDPGGPSAVVAAGRDAAVVQARADRMSAPGPGGRRPTAGTPSVRRRPSTVVPTRPASAPGGADEIPAE